MEAHVWTDIKLKPDQNILSDIIGEQFDILAEFAVGESDEFGFLLNGREIKYNCKQNRLSCGDSEAILRPVGDKIKLRILVDRVSVEVYANDGRIYMPLRAIPDSDQGIAVFTNGGNVQVNSLEVFELKSIWQDSH